MSKKSSNVEQKQKEAKDASERLIQMENEQRVKELELQKLTAELQLTKQRTDDARKVAALNKSRAEEAERRSQVSDNDTVQNFLINRHLEKHSELPNENKEQQRQTFSPIRLKGVDLPIFSGEEKSDYESWKAAFLSVVDRRDIPVGEKMLRLQGCLSGKALTMVKDLGYLLNAYERAKAKLEKKYGGERRLQIKHLTALRNFRKVRPRNLEDMEEFQVLLERVLIATQDSGPLHGQSLNLTAKEKLPEEDIQAYKYWLMDHSREDNFKALEEWVEVRVQVIEEAKEETNGIGKKTDNRVEQKKRFQGFNTRFTTRCCIVPNCKEDHPPWVCKAFKDLPVLKRK
jgi:hypothetical protein